MWAEIFRIMIVGVIKALQGKLGADLVELVQKAIAAIATEAAYRDNPDKRALTWQLVRDEAMEVGGDVLASLDGVPKRMVNLLIEALLVRNGINDGSIK